MIYVEIDNHLEPVDLEVLLEYKNIHSHEMYNVGCDFNISNKCRFKYKMEFRQYVKLTSNNNGKLPCLFCSRTMKFSNRNNPNTKYKMVNDYFFSTIDSEEKAYLLGWIASDGHISKKGFRISISYKDKEILLKLRDIICKEIPIKTFKTPTGEMVSFEVYSKQISKDLCNHLNIMPGKKDAIVNFPLVLVNNLLAVPFIRGYFDGDGTLNSFYISNKKYPTASIRSNSINMLNSLKSITPFKCSIFKCISIHWSCGQTINFLDMIYGGTELFLKRKYNRYIEWKKHYIPYNYSHKKGIDSPNFGLKRSDKTKTLISLSKVGEKSVTSKLTWKQVDLIRKEYKSEKTSFRKLAKKYGVSGSCIGNIINNETWKILDKSFL